MNFMDVMNLRSDLICRGDEQEVVSVPTSAEPYRSSLKCFESSTIVHTLAIFYFEYINEP